MRQFVNNYTGVNFSHGSTLTIHTGYDLALGQAYVALYHWIKDNSYQITGPARQVRLRYGEYMEPAQYVTEVQFPIQLTEKG